MKKQTKYGNTRKTDTSGIGSHSNKTGITLISLVITIIILIILAAITINLTIGQKGILTRAEEAGRNYQQAAKEEDEMLKDLLEEIDTSKEPKNHDVYAKVYESKDGQKEILVLSSNVDYVENSEELTLRKDYGNVGNKVWTMMNPPPWIRDGLNFNEVRIVDKISPLSLAHWFNGSSNLTQIDLKNLDTSNVEYMTAMFLECTGLTQIDVSNFDTSNVKNMFFMFAGCTGLTKIDVSNWDTSNVIDMSAMFTGCMEITQLDVSNWDTSNVTNMSYMFAGYTGITQIDVSNFDTSKVTNMSGMFKGCTGITQIDVSNFDTSKVTNMSEMFSTCTGLTQIDLSNFDTSKVTDMSQMFENSSNLTSILVGAKWKEPEKKEDMFKGCKIDSVTLKQE